MTDMTAEKPLRSTILEILASTRGESEGHTADAILSALTAPRVPDELRSVVADIRAHCNPPNPETCDEVSASYALYWADRIEALITAAPAPVDDGPVASIDDIWVASGKEYDRSIHSNPDHYAWAELFVSTFPNLRADVDTMAGWFANAMMAKVDSMRDHTGAPAPADSEQLKCNTCGESTDDPWHYSLVGNRHLHACDACWRSVNPAIADKIVPLMERVAELEGYNIGLANESHELRERVKVLEEAALEVTRLWADGAYSPEWMLAHTRIADIAARLRGGSDD